MPGGGGQGKSGYNLVDKSGNGKIFCSAIVVSIINIILSTNQALLYTKFST